MQFKIACFEVKKFGEEDWKEVPEKTALEKLVDHFNPVSPVITKMLQGDEVVAEKEIYRIKS